MQPNKLKLSEDEHAGNSTTITTGKDDFNIKLNHPPDPLVIREESSSNDKSLSQHLSEPYHSSPIRNKPRTP
jgi:hypothetical protein